MPPIDIPGYGTVAPWRLTFVAVGAPGLLIALLLATVKEPPRRSASVNPVANESVPLREALVEIAARWRSLIGLAVTIGCQALSNYALLGWGPSFFERLHAWPRSQIGLVLGTLAIVSGCIGLYTGGRLADSWQRAGRTDATLRVVMISLFGVGATLPLAFLLPAASGTVTVLAFAVFFIGLPIGCGYAGLQFILPNRIRGLASAVVILIVNLMGLGIGSFLPGCPDRDPLEHHRHPGSADHHAPLPAALRRDARADTRPDVSPCQPLLRLTHARPICADRSEAPLFRCLTPIGNTNSYIRS
jgi:hypothetical protein